MIQLHATPTDVALARLEGCSRRAREAADAGEDMPDSVANCYRHPDVKASVEEDTFGKCAYCESKVTHVYYGDVEHILPKSRFPLLRLSYENLTLSCAICNNKKGDYYNEEAPILHPYSENPEEHLVGLGPLIWHRNGSPKGQRTIELLELNRARLREQRLERLHRLSALADRFIAEPDGPIKKLLADQIHDEADCCAEFSLVARSFLLATHRLQWDAL